MKRKAIQITIKRGLREVKDEIVTWTNPTTKTGILYPPRRYDKDFLKFQCYYLVKQLLNSMHPEPQEENHHKRRKSDK